MHCVLVTAIFVATVFYSFYAFSAILVNKDNEKNGQGTSVELS